MRWKALGNNTGPLHKRRCTRCSFGNSANFVRLINIIFGVNNNETFFACTVETNIYINVIIIYINVTILQCHIMTIIPSE